MRTTMILDKELVATAKKYSGIERTTALVHQALREMIHRRASQRLAEMGGMYPDFQAPPRRRFAPASKRKAG